MFAAIGDTPYNITLLLHILAVMIAFAPAFVHPLLASQLRADGDPVRQAVLSHMIGNGRRIYAPALIIAGLLGFGLSGMSEDVYPLSQGWLLASIVAWIAINGVLHAVIIPGEKAVAAGDESGQRKLDLGGGILTMLLLITLVLMIFKPGV